MDTYTDEEQVDRIKQWWQENGVSLMVSIVVAVAAVLGWRNWQDNQQANTDAASVAYQDLLESVAALEDNNDDIQIASAVFKAESLKQQGDQSAYAHFAAFFKARQAVLDEDYVTAEEELNWVLTHKPSSQLKAIAELRLAKILVAKGDSASAIELLVDGDDEVMNYAKAELKGDILLNDKDFADAVEAYQQAETLASMLQLRASQTLELKLNHAKSFL